MSVSRILLMVATVFLFGLPQAAQAAFISCRLEFEAEEWSIFYKEVDGTGTVRCDNGETARVKLRFRGGGITFGVATLNGKARFSEVRELEEVLGTYVAMDGHGGFIKGGVGRVMSKGSVWVSQSAHGNGVNLGFSMGSMSIQR